MGSEVPVGVAEELYIGGPIVSSGYLKRPELTQHAFTQDPSATPAEIEAGDGRLYRTGDACCLHPDGSIEFLGRISGDRQVKIRGIRTKLAEIEGRIFNFLTKKDLREQVGASIVAAAYHETDNNKSGCISVYIVAKDSFIVNSTVQPSVRSSIRSHIRENLPPQMVPGAILFVQSLPCTATGKTDYKTIDAWPAPKLDASSHLVRPTSELECFTESHQAIATVWQIVLQSDAEFLPSSDFFSAGGHSILLIQSQDEVKARHGVILPLAGMFSKPTLQGLSTLLGMKLREQHTTKTFNQVNGEKHSKKSTSTALDFTERGIDWEAETSLSNNVTSHTIATSIQPSAVVAMTGACTMIGAYFIEHFLGKTDVSIHCLATQGDEAESARYNILQNLERRGLLQSIKPSALERVHVYAGNLSSPALGLSNSQIAALRQQVNSIYVLDSKVSLFKRYEDLSASNVGSLKFVISLAASGKTPAKPIFYLSTWGVPHLQTWKDSELEGQERLRNEVEMSNMQPGANSDLGYLKARWACERLLGHASRCGIRVCIFRACMCGTSPRLRDPVPLPCNDVNRRILEASLQTGLVPDFASKEGGGMSWVSADFIIQSMAHLAEGRTWPRNRIVDAPTGPEIYHLVSMKHVPYVELPQLLGHAYDGRPMRCVPSEEWFAALHATKDVEMAMHAEVLEQWCNSGWVPFALDARRTLEVLKTEKNLEPPDWDREFLLRNVVGRQGF